VTLERVYFTPYFDEHCLNDFPETRDSLLAYNDLCHKLASQAASTSLKAGCSDSDPCKQMFQKIVAEVNHLPFIYYNIGTYGSFFLCRTNPPTRYRRQSWRNWFPTIQSASWPNSSRNFWEIPLYGRPENPALPLPMVTLEAWNTV